MMIGKVLAILLYLTAIVAGVTQLLGEAGMYVIYAVLAILVAHVLELAVALKYLRRYPGGMAQSVVLCLLFGFMHWWPLKSAAEA